MQIKQLCLTILIASFTMGIHSTASASLAQDKSVDKLIELSNVTELFKQSTRDLQPYYDEQAEDLVRQVTGSSTLNIDQQNAVLQISALYSDAQQQMVSDPEFIHMFKALFKRTFTEEEIQANIAFLSTPLGQSINQKMNVLMSEILQETTKFSQQRILNSENQKVLKAKMEAILKPILPIQ